MIAFAKKTCWKKRIKSIFFSKTIDLSRRHVFHYPFFPRRMHVRDFLNIFWYSVWERDVGRFAGEKKRGPGETLEEEEEKVLTRNLLSHKRRRKEEKTEDVSSEKKPRAGAAKIGGGGRRKCLSDFRQNNSRSRRENTSLLHLSYTLFFRDAAASSIFFLRFFLSA